MGKQNLKSFFTSLQMSLVWDLPPLPSRYPGYAIFHLSSKIAKTLAFSPCVPSGTMEQNMGQGLQNQRGHQAPLGLAVGQVCS